MHEATVIFICIVALASVRKMIIMSFQNGYYKQKLVNRGVDVSEVDKIGLWEVLFK